MTLTKPNLFTNRKNNIDTNQQFLNILAVLYQDAITDTRSRKR